jgi:hypothetical protein
MRMLLFAFLVVIATPSAWAASGGGGGAAYREFGVTYYRPAKQRIIRPAVPWIIVDDKGVPLKKKKAGAKKLTGGAIGSVGGIGKVGGGIGATETSPIGKIGNPAMEETIPLEDIDLYGDLEIETEK